MILFAFNTTVKLRICDSDKGSDLTWAVEQKHSNQNSGTNGHLCILKLVDKKSQRSHKTVEIKVFLTILVFLLDDTRIRIRNTDTFYTSFQLYIKVSKLSYINQTLATEYQRFYVDAKHCKKQCCGSRKFVSDPGSVFFHPVPRISDPISKKRRKKN